VPNFTLNPLTHNQVAISLIENGIQPTKKQFNQHSIGATCWCHPELRAISQGGNMLVFNHHGGGETAKNHYLPRYFDTALDRM
jgi:hypothetical protein